MPTTETEDLTPAARMTKGLCPECGYPLVGLNILGHRDGHWGERQVRNRLEGQALARFTMLTNYAAAQGPKA